MLLPPVMSSSPSAFFRWMRRKASCLLLCLPLLAGCQVEIYQGLSENQANAMLALLLKYGIDAEKKAAKTGYILCVDDNSIVQSLELLKENSLPRESYESLGKVFSAQGMISSSTEEQARLTYAISQELADTFSRIDGVLTARVHVVLATTDVATGKTTPPSAAVFLRHVPESQVTRLAPHIRELTSNAVPGLKRESVSVMFVPTRETISVPMSPEKSPMAAPVLVPVLGGGVIVLLATSGALAFLLVRDRRRKAAAKDGDDGKQTT